LATPIPDGKSAIWCSSFQLAWNRLKTKVLEEPVRLRNGGAVVDRLNQADEDEEDLPKGSFYVASGVAGDGFLEKIRAEQAAWLPGSPLPNFDAPPGTLVLYAYLAAGVNYPLPYFVNDRPLLFRDSSGNQTAVRSFGIREQDEYAYRKLRDQVRVLYCPEDAIWQNAEVREFVLDLCKDSDPNQLMVARIPQPADLAQAVAVVEQRIAVMPSTGLATRFHVRDRLLVPMMAWRVLHRFKELEGSNRQLLNRTLKGASITWASQTVDFRMDQGGAALASEAKVYVKPGASWFTLNGPFLVCLKKRNAPRPFFVMWVENAELLNTWGQ
jgi:hypothetical protein